MARIQEIGDFLFRISAGRRPRDPRCPEHFRTLRLPVLCRANNGPVAIAPITDSLVTVEVGGGSKCPRDLTDLRWGYIQFIHDTTIAYSFWFLSGDPGIDALGSVHLHASARLPKDSPDRRPLNN